MSNRIALVAPVRTPIGKFGGALASLSAADLGTEAAKACLERAGISGDSVDQAIFGHARQAGGGPNTARQISYRAGVPQTSPAFTVNQACGSGLQSIFAAARAIKLGEAEVVLAGGTESMSNTPYMLPRARWGYRMGSTEVADGMYKDGFNDPLSGLIMGGTAEELGEEKGVTRDQADDYAVESQSRCEKAQGAGRFEREIAPLTFTERRREITVTTDEHPRAGVTADKLKKLPTVFREGGSVTPGNASGITDGAAALLVMSESKAEELGVEVAGWLIDWEVVGVDPRIMGIGPVPAVEKLLAKTGVSIDEIDEMELNEAFATQAIACLQDIEIDPAKVNPDGGAIALGHPIGCTGTRILVTLLHGMAERGGKRGIATLCVSGGLGLAALVERA